MAIDELISVIPYQPHWVDFNQERQCLQENIQHIGSTAPGLAAKPIIDIMFGGKITDLMAGIKSFGYEYLGEAGVPGRLYFRKRKTDAFNVHLVQCRAIWANNLLKNYLRSHPEAAKEYGQYKQKLVESGIVTLMAYSQQKSKMIAQLLQRARSWEQLKRQSGTLPNVTQR